MVKFCWFAFMLVFTGFFSRGIIADQFHYKNMLVGERAMGLAGAFTAVADDASGLIYNPAGLAFALSNDITGSANAFYQRRIVYKNTIAGEDFVERSGGTTAPFFGGLQKLDEVYPGLAAAFGIFNLDSELKDQDDLITNKVLGEDLVLDRFHRTTNMRSGTMGIGAGLGLRVRSGLAFGVSLAYLMVDELVQEYQDVVYANGNFLTQNYRTHLAASALETGLGVQMAFSSFSFGLNVKLRNIIGENFDVSRDSWSNIGQEGGVAVPQPLKFSFEAPLEEMPTEIRFGAAWFASTRLLWTADVTHHTEVQTAYFPRNAVTNFATGIEYYITPAILVRTGAFTNYDARPEVVEGKANQFDHINYLGYSLFLALVQSNSQISFGGIYQQGEGKAQKVSGGENPPIQNVEAESITVAFSATHSF